MSLTSSLFSGVSGLAATGNAMTVIGDNIANVNTIGFKSSRVTFQDVLGQTVATPGALEALGRNNSTGLEYLRRHASGDWGIVCEDDKQANSEALESGARLLSAS